ncbi:hypothetical protein [Psychromonas sp. Urea-02u-13]|uniref:hypothetical protein n=1 Tax=Psychromonas sp. Urea-02u-13 TaxID=2058326 RepID=UPI000C33EBDE|nr:hypothetical protein [Psychromonas sp. Urea-02u-13]PKG36960.1 hypothetical protein CXF74_21410 [Psychromonas sp. Urea-02u-13]
MKKIIFATAFATIFAFSAQAASRFTFTPQANKMVGLYLGGQIGQSETKGDFGEGNTIIDFNLEKELQFNYFFAVVHPYPLLPNILISSTTFNTTGKTNLTQEFSFGDEDFLIGDDINASFDVSYVDYTLYYELYYEFFHNTFFSFDLGLTVRDFDAAISVTGQTSDDDCIQISPNHHHCTSAQNSETHTGKKNTTQLNLCCMLPLTFECR